MSRIYEALRQAELDSAKQTSTGIAPDVHPAPAERIVPDPAQAEPIAQPEAVQHAPELQQATPLAEPAPAAPIATSAEQAVPDPVLEDSLIHRMTAPAPVPEANLVTASSPQPIPVAFRRTVPVAIPPDPTPVAVTPFAAAPVTAAAMAAPIASPSVSVSVPVAPGAIAPVDQQLWPDNIAQYNWLPSLHQLPALEHRGAAVEQFRSLRSRMQEFRDLNTLKSILVSSGLPQEGKSFVAANLAISFARHKANRVLLIDGDMRRASLHKLLGAPQGPGLTEYLAGKATLNQIMQRPMPSASGQPLPNGLVSLVFIPGGRAADKAADLSGNRRFDRLIADAAPFFDWIVVDSSPVNLVSDGVNLARSCDGVLLIAREGTTKYEVAQRALAELKASKVLGFVLNAVKDPPNTGGYYGYDGYDSIEE
jgi:capsular exopolysaccharide synthesis family protein